MEQRIVLVTGAGQGVWQGIALAFAAAGDKVILAGRTLAKLEETARLIAGRGIGEAVPVACDVRSAESIARLMEESFLRRTAVAGDSPMPTTSEACRISTRPGLPPHRSISA